MELVRRAASTASRVFSRQLCLLVVTSPAAVCGVPLLSCLRQGRHASLSPRLKLSDEEEARRLAMLLNTHSRPSFFKMLRSTVASIGAVLSTSVDANTLKNSSLG